MNRLTYLLIFSLLCLLPLSASAYTITNTTVSEDTYVDIGVPNTNYGSLTLPDLGPSSNKRTYLKFSNITIDIPAGMTINSATLYFYTDMPGVSNISYNAVTSSWVESEVTWNTKPTNGSVLGYFTNATTPDITSADITGLFSDWYNGIITNYGMNLNSNTYGLIVTKEYNGGVLGDHAAYISVNYTYVPPEYPALGDEYVFVSPGTIVYTSPTAGSVYYKTLDETNPCLLGGGNYIIYIYPQGSSTPLYANPVGSETESSFPFSATIPIGNYDIKLTGYTGGCWDFQRDIIYTNNFTITSNVSTLSWEKSNYYLGEEMILNAFIVTTNKVVNITYPNGTVSPASKTLTPSGNIQKITIPTSSNASLNNYPPGTYTAMASGVNSSFTQLLNAAYDVYSLSVPSTAVWGSIFYISYSSPQTSTLYATIGNNSIIMSQDVSGVQVIPFNTSAMLTNQNDAVIFSLMQNGGALKTSTVTITAALVPDTQVNTVINFIANPIFWALIFIAGLMIFIAKVTRK